MWKPLIRCSVVGGVVVFLWMMVSWTVLPLHKAAMHKFVDQQEVAQTVMRYAPKDGIYVIPSWEEDKPPVQGVPFIFVNIQRGVDFTNMSKNIVVGIITQIIGAALITYLLLRAKAMKYWRRVWFVTIAGITVAILGTLPAWNWWHFPGCWVLLDMIDVVLGWFLGGLVIAKLVKN